jgi:hypothetical protein
MRYIENVAQTAKSMDFYSMAVWDLELKNQKSIANRLAMAEQNETGLDGGWIIIPLIFIIALGGWLIPLMTIAYCLAPLIGLLLVLWDRLVPPSATDIYHGR